MPIVMISMVISETSNYMNVIIVRMSSEKSMYELQFKNKQKIMKNYNWEYFKSQINKKLSEPETKNIYSQRKIDVEPVFGFMKAILGFTRMSVPRTQ
ncbi:transposase [Staphylococcus aureus]